MDILAALFIDGIDLRQVEGPSTRIDLTGVQFSAAAPAPVPVTVEPHLVVIVHNPADGRPSAALEVVYRRLEGCGLGDFCFELHSHKTTRRRVVEELRRVLELPRRKSMVKDELIERLKETRAALNRYAREVGEPVAPLGLSPRAAIGRLAALEAVPEVAVYLRGAVDWDRERYESHTAVSAGAGRHPCRGQKVAWSLEVVLPVYRGAPPGGNKLWGVRGEGLRG